MNEPITVNDWIKLHTAEHPVEAGFVRGLLEAEGIETRVRSMELWTVAVEIYFTEGARPSVWVRRRDVEKARAVLDESDRSASGKPWTCQGCDERLEGQFTACWRCGTERGRT